MDVASLRGDIERLHRKVFGGAQCDNHGNIVNQMKAGYLQALEEVLELLPEES